MMEQMVWDEYGLGNLPHRERLDKCKELILNDKRNPMRWIGIYVAGQICYETEEFNEEIGDLMSYVIHHEQNDVVKHEACFQIGLHNFTAHVNDLIEVAVHHRYHVLSQHEAIEALGLMRANKDYIIKELNHLAIAGSEPVRVTAQFVLELLELMKNMGEYRGGKV